MGKDNWVKLTGVFTIIGAISAVIVIPELREFLGLRNREVILFMVPRASAEPLDKADRQPTAEPSGSLTEGTSGYYVIAYTSDNQEVALHGSRRQNQNGFRTHVAYSSNWSGFTPGLYIVVYGIYDNKADAIDVLTRAEKQGVKAYIKHSGNRIH